MVPSYRRQVESSASEVVIRPAGERDVERIAEIMHGVPGPELVALMGGDRERAAAFGKGLVMLDLIPNKARTVVVAECAGAVVGVLQYMLDTSDAGVNLKRASLALRVAGPIRLMRAIPRIRARQRVELVARPGAFYVAEIHVEPSWRGQGIGARLLDWAEQEAMRQRRTHMALTTYSTNRARHLYERAGYTVTRERTDSAYERYTGIRGRVLMEKQLG
jgi:ribosomal protein S18 acetylase RimI-like enzyme